MVGSCVKVDGSDNGWKNDYYALGTYTNKNYCLKSCHDYYMISSGEYTSGCEHDHGVDNQCYLCYLDSYIVSLGDSDERATCWVIKMHLFL